MFSYLDDMLKECCTTSPRVMLHSASSSKGDGGSCTPVQKICAITLRCTGCRHTYATSPLPHRFFGPGCANLVASSQVNTTNNLSSSTLKCWCIHPNLIPREINIFVPKEAGAGTHPWFTALHRSDRGFLPFKIDATIHNPDRDPGGRGMARPP
jgi:hypothetical protein